MTRPRLLGRKNRRLEVGDRVVWVGLDGPLQAVVIKAAPSRVPNNGLARVREESGEETDVATLQDGSLPESSMWKVAP